MSPVSTVASLPPAASAPAPRLAMAGRPAPFAPLCGVFFKELYQTAKYVIFIWLLLGLFVAVTFWIDIPQSSGTRNFAYDSILFHQGMQQLSAIACPAGALLLAVVQVFAERSFDLRAFAWHRAMTPTRLFWAKCLAGLTLYTVAMGGAILVWIGYAAGGRHGGFVFDIHFAQPYGVDFLVGASYYFAGFLAAQRHARWYMSRLIPLAMAVGVSALSIVIFDFWAAVLLTLLLAGLLALGAWDNFIHAGLATALGQPVDITRQWGADLRAVWARRLGRWAVPLVILLGTTMVGWTAYICDAGIAQWLDWQELGRRPQDFVSRPKEGINENYGLLLDGKPARIVRHWRTVKTSNGAANSEYTDTWFDLDGHEHPEMVALEKARDEAEAKNRPEPPRDPHAWFDSDIGYSWVRHPSYRDPAGQVNVLTDNQDYPVGQGRGERWYYLVAQHYFVGYESTGRLIGTVGRTNFRPAGQAPEPFSKNAVLLGNNFLADGNVLYEVGFYYDSAPGRQPSHYAEPLFTAPAGETVCGARLLDIPSSSQQGETGVEWRPVYVILTDQRIYTCEWNRKAKGSSGLEARCSIPLEHPLAAYTVSVTYHLSTGDFSVWYHDARNRLDGDQYVSTYTEEGERVAQYTLPPLPHPDYTPHLNALDRQAVVAVGMLDALRNPLIVETLQRLFARYEENPHPYRNFLFFAEFIDGGFPLPKVYFAGLAAPIILATGLVFLFTRRYRCTYAGTAGWTLATLLMGPVVLLTFLFTQPFAKRVRCPSCRKKRAVTREQCAHCGAPFPTPPRDGTEVFTAYGK